MTENVKCSGWEDGYTSCIKPGVWVPTPEQEAFINGPYFKKKEEMYRRDLKEHPLPWGPIIWND